MKMTLTTDQIAHELYNDDMANWSYHGAYALAEFLEEMEADVGGEHELDVVAIRCDFTEYGSALEACEALYLEADTEENALNELRDLTTVVEVYGHPMVIVQDF